MYQGLYLSFKAQSLPQMGVEGIVSSLVSCCRTDTGLSSGVNLGIARLNSKGGGGGGALV